MPQGHDITIHGENFDVYLFDPHATSDNDLLTPSDDSLFHVRSRISGQMLPFIGLSNFTQDLDYMTDVKAAIKRVIEHGGKDQDVISMMPNKEIVGDRQVLNFAHLLDYAVLNKSPTGQLSDDEIQLRQSPIGHFINRYHYASSLFTPISRLHEGNSNTPISYENYQAIMDVVTKIANTPDLNPKLAFDSQHFLFTWQSRVVNQDGNAEFLRRPETPVIPHISLQVKAGFFKNTKELVDTVLSHHQNNDDILRLGEAANRVAHVSQAEHVLQRITRYLSVDVPASDETNSHHPAIVAAARLLTDNNPYLSADDLLQSRLFDPTHTHSPTATDDRKSAFNTEGMRQLSMASTHEGGRNVFQLAERCEWNPMLFTSWGNETSTLLSDSIYSIFWRDVEDGKPLRQILRDTMSRDEQLNNKDPERRPLSKRSANLYLHNATAMDRINTAIRHYDGCESETLYTDSGERFVISFDPLVGVNDPIKHQAGITTTYLGFPREARITYLDANGEVIFDHQGRVNPNGTANDNRKLRFNSLFKHPLHFLQLPAGKIESYQELSAVVGSQANNKTLSKMMATGYLAHLDQQRDDQGRKVAKKDYQSWMEVAKKHADSADDLNKYLNDDYLKDSNVIAEDVARSLFLNMAKGSGLAVGSHYHVNDLTNDDEIDKSDAFTLNGEKIDLDFTSLQLIDKHKTPINYKKDMVEKADHLHHVGASLVKDHMPQADLEWEPATDTIPMGTTHDGTRFEARPLSSYHEIQRHGQSMSHCAGTYASKCMGGNYYLWAIIAIDPDGNEKEFSTLGMNHENNELEFDQHFGYNNASVPQPVSGMVDQLSNDLYQASQGCDADEWDHDDWDDKPDHEEDREPERPRYDVTFEATSYGGGDDLTSEEVAEVIANYHWQSEEFGQDAMRLLSRTYGEEAIKDVIIHNIDENLENKAEYHWPSDLVTRMKEFRQAVERYDLHCQETPSHS